MDDCNPSLLAVDSIEAYFRFPVPRAIVQLLQHCPGADGRIDYGPGSRLHNWVGVFISSSTARPTNCPPELMLIGETGLDGVVCGCVMHDPKLVGEMPLALFDPTTGRADYLGLDTRRSIGVLIGMQLAQLTDDRLQDARALAEEVGFDPDELPVEPPLDVRPRIPPGWRFAATADGLGVVAQAGHFAPGQEYDEEPEGFDSTDTADAIALAEQALADRFAATALWHLRNAMIFVESPAHASALRQLAQRVYASLARESLCPLFLAQSCC